jgi:hypothetical protein
MVIGLGDPVSPRRDGGLQQVSHLTLTHRAASNPTIKPVERLGSTRGEVELNANLTSAFV